jgi:hypothetical protein
MDTVQGCQEKNMDVTFVQIVTLLEKRKRYQIRIRTIFSNIPLALQQ